MLFTVAHELTHYIRANSPAKFKAFSDFLFEKYAEKGVRVSDLIEAKKAFLKKKGTITSKMSAAEAYDLAYEEVVANACEIFLSDGKAAEKIAELKTRDKGLWKTIKDYITKLSNKIRAAYLGMTPDSYAGKRTAEMLDSVEELRKRWIEAVVDASEASGTVDGATKATDTQSVKNMERESDFSDYDKPITVSDVEVLRSIGRKSINKFSSEDIKKAQKWAYKFYKELGTKSPFFRAWFGEWRAQDISKAEIVDTKADNRKDVVNLDTNWKIQTSKKVHKETSHHSGSAEVNAVKYLPYIDDITIKAVLFDSVISDKDNPNSLMFHTMYAYTKVMGYPALLKLQVEELFYHNNQESGELMRDYILQNIEEEPISKRNRLSRSNHLDKDSSTISISDLYEFVKTYDKDFSSAPEVSKAVLNDDGTPKVFYHGTNEEFTEFSSDEIAASEGSFFFAENREDAAAYGKNVFEVYLSGKNLADYDNQPSEFYYLKNKREQVNWLKERGYDGWYADMDSGGWGEVSVFSAEQIKSAADNIGTFDSTNKDIRFSEREDIDNDWDNGYNLYTASDEYQREVTPRDKHTFARSLANKTSGMVDGDTKTIYIYCPDKVYTFVANGYMQGYISISEQVDIIDARKRRFEENYENDFDPNGTVAGLWSQSVSNQSGRQVDNARVSSRGRRSAFDDILFENTSSGKGRGNNERVRENTYSEEEAKRIIKELKEMYGLSENTDGTKLKYSDRDADSFSDRSLLANALESVAQNDVERQKIAEYRANIANYEAQQQKLSDLKRQIKEMSFAKGPRDKDAITKLRIEATKTENRINIYDKRLLNLEATKALKDVLEREKAKAYKRAEDKGRELLRAQREKAEAKLTATVEKYQESRRISTEGRRKTEERHKIFRVVQRKYYHY